MRLLQCHVIPSPMLSVSEAIMFACIHLRPPLRTGDADVLLRCVNVFSPRIEETIPGTIVLDLEGLERLLGSLDKIAESIGEQVRMCRLNTHIAIASNPDTAIHLARGHAGVTIVKRGNERQALSGLGVEVLAPDPEVLETLDRWGIRTLGSLAELPASQIAARLGQDGVRLHQLARGIRTRPLVARAEPERFVETTELDDSIELLESLTFILAPLLDRLCLSLETRGLATHEITLRLKLEKKPVFSRVLRLPVPVRHSRLVLKLFMLDLEAHPPGPPGAAITGVEVEARPARPRVVQGGLFVPLSPEPEKLELTLARIAAIVGEHDVGTPELLDTHRREAFRMRHFGENGDRDSRGGPGKMGHLRLSLRPIRIFRPPLEATVQLRNGIPVRIAFSGFHGAVETASGPWRGSGDWWNDRQWDRQEWDIEVAPAAVYRVYFDHAVKRWFAEGVYD
jgi:protein ImuB